MWYLALTLLLSILHTFRLLIRKGKASVFEINGVTEKKKRNDEKTQLSAYKVKFLGDYLPQWLSKRIDHVIETNCSRWGYVDAISFTLNARYDNVY